MKDKADRNTQLFDRSDFFSSLEIFKPAAQTKHPLARDACRLRMMQAPAQSSQLLPGPFLFSRLCSALTLAGLAFYACAPELIAPELAPLPAQRQTACSWFRLFATAIAICIA
jgi:hypothetical protein